MNQAMRQSPNKVRLLTTAAVTFGGAAVLALTDARAMHIIKVMMTIIGVTLVLGVISGTETKRSTSNVSEKGGNNAENQHLNLDMAILILACIINLITAPSFCWRSCHNG